MNKITLYLQDSQRMDDGDLGRPDWFLPRYEAFHYYSPMSFFKCLEELRDSIRANVMRTGAFADYHGRSLEVGDMCKVWDMDSNESAYYLFCSTHWQRKEVSDKEIFEIIEMFS